MVEMETWSSYELEREFSDAQNIGGNMNVDARRIVNRLVDEHNKALKELRLWKKVISHLDERDY
jgi:hypothetical protein